jgi:anti-sigma B factor antagonist
VEIAIGIFESRALAEEAVKELQGNQIPGEAIIFLTGSEKEALSFRQEVGAYVGGLMGGAVQASAGQLQSALALIPGFGQVYAIGIGGAALLGYLGAKLGAKAARSYSENFGSTTRHGRTPLNAMHFIEVMRHGRSIVIVQSKFRDVAEEATRILDRLGLGEQTSAEEQAATAATEETSGETKSQAPVTAKAQTSMREADGITIVDLRGRIDFGDGSKKLREMIEKIIAGGSKNMLVNMKEVDFVDSSGIGEMVRGHVALCKIGGHLKLVNLSKHVKRLLEVTALNKVFEVFDDEAAAITSFESH